MLENGNQGRLAHRADETLATARDRDVDKTDRTDHFGNRGVIENLDELHRPGKNAERLAERPRQSRVGTDRLFPAAENNGVAGLQAKCGRIDQNVRARLENDGDDSERFAHLPDADSARALARPYRLADRIGERGDIFDTLDHRIKTRGRKGKAVGHRGGKSGCRGGFHVLGVRRVNLVPVGAKLRGDGAERGVLLFRREFSKFGGRGARGGGERTDRFLNSRCLHKKSPQRALPGKNVPISRPAASCESVDLRPLAMYVSMPL